MLPYIKIYADFIDIVRELDNGARGRLFYAIMQYANGEEPSDLTGGEKIAFLTIKGQINRDRDVYAKTSEKRSIAGQSGAKRRWENKEKMANAILPLANDSKNSNCQQDKDKDKDKDKEEDKEKKKEKRFAPPTRDEVHAYCRQRNSPVDPDKFFDFFEAGDWVDSKGKRVTAWKQKLITWEKFDHNPKPEKKPVSFADLVWDNEPEVVSYD